MPASRRAFLQAAAFIGAPAHAQPATGAVPVSGQQHSALAGVDAMVLAFMREYRVPGAALAVTRESRLVYARGFGLADRLNSQVVQPASLFRIASISKPITAVAVLQLAERGKLDLHARAWEMLGLAEPSDARWKQVSIWQLLHHSGGWDDRMFDAMFQSTRIAKALGTSQPVNQQQIIRYMLGQPLQFDPGSRFAYSNFSYCLLGRIIERAAGMGYEQYVQREVLAPLGIRRMRLGGTLASQRVAGEVTYYDEGGRTAPAVVGAVGEQVPLPYGAWSLEAMDANGGWLASAADLARFACAFDSPAMCPILQPKTIALMVARPDGPAGTDSGGNYPGCAWFVWPQHRQPHNAYMSTNGQLAGTATYLMRRHDGTNWAVLFNTANAPDGKPLMLKFRDASGEILQRTADWPVTDQFPDLL